MAALCEYLGVLFTRDGRLKRKTYWQIGASSSVMYGGPKLTEIKADMYKWTNK